jgi:hypothetical protein
VFGNNHGFNLWQTGLTFLGLFVGNLIGVSCDPLWRRNCTFSAAWNQAQPTSHPLLEKDRARLLK